MLKLTSFTVQVLKINVIQVAWPIESTEEELGDYRFALGRSNSPGGPFEPIVSDLINIFEFIDQAPQMKSNWRKIYYRLTIRNARTGEVLECPVKGLEADPDLFLLEIRRRNDLYLERFVGVPAAVLIKKTWGQRCPVCWDKIKQRVNSSSCQTCFTVGFVGGYFPQVNTFVNFSPSPEMVAILDLGEGQPNGTNVWMSNYPRLSKGDMIVEFPERRMWAVNTVGKTERLRATSRQIAQVQEVNRNGVEYKLAVETFIPEPDVFIGFRPPNGSALL